MRKHVFKTRLTAFLLLLILSVSAVVPAYAQDSNPQVSSADWMSQIDGDLSLAQFTIPGTHDSCTRYCLLGRCQSLSISSQLNAGARFLDIRLQDEGGYLECYHGFVNCMIKFGDVMKAVSAFLEEHPSECVLMSVKNEGDNSAGFESMLVDKWINSKYPDLFFTEDRIPSLDEVRGKIVLMRRYKTYDPDLTLGINAYNNWADNAVFSFDRTGFRVFAQDICSYDTVGLLFGKQKFENFLAFDTEVTASPLRDDADTLFLNFASGCNSIACGQLSCATAVNCELRSLFKNAAGNHGVVILDFADSGLVKLIYGCNFR